MPSKMKRDTSVASSSQKRHPSSRQTQTLENRLSVVGSSAQRAEYPLIEEYTLNGTRVPYLIYGIFFN